MIGKHANEKWTASSLFSDSSNKKKCHKNETNEYALNITSVVITRLKPKK